MNSEAKSIAKLEDLLGSDQRKLFFAAVKKSEIIKLDMMNY